MVNNNNLNLTKKKEVDAKFSDKDLEAHSFQVKEENMGFKELYEQSLNQIQYGNIAQ